LLRTTPRVSEANDFPKIVIPTNRRNLLLEDVTDEPWDFPRDFTTREGHGFQSCRRGVKMTRLQPLRDLAHDHLRVSEASNSPKLSFRPTGGICFCMM
jgi:hypothetical protein